MYGTILPSCVSPRYVGSPTRRRQGGVFQTTGGIQAVLLVGYALIRVAPVPYRIRLNIFNKTGKFERRARRVPSYLVPSCAWSHLDQLSIRNLIYSGRDIVPEVPPPYPVDETRSRAIDSPLLLLGGGPTHPH